MKKKVLLPFLWLAACCMLLVTIVPHHHHIDGRICLQLSEIPEDGQNRDITHRPDCETDCLARFTAYRTSVGNPDLLSNIFIALPAALITFDLRPNETGHTTLLIPYKDSCISEYKGLSSGLRAPPHLIGYRQSGNFQYLPNSYYRTLTTNNSSRNIIRLKTNFQ